MLIVSVYLAHFFICKFANTYVCWIPYSNITQLKFNKKALLRVGGGRSGRWLAFSQIFWIIEMLHPERDQ